MLMKKILLTSTLIFFVFFLIDRSSIVLLYTHLLSLQYSSGLYFSRALSSIPLLTVVCLPSSHTLNYVSFTVFPNTRSNRILVIIGLYFSTGSTRQNTQTQPASSIFVSALYCKGTFICTWSVTS